MDVTSYKGQILSKGAKLVTLVENTNFHLKFIYSPLRIGVQSVLPGNEKWVAPLSDFPLFMEQIILMPIILMGA